jgi:hypothetical protein
MTQIPKPTLPEAIDALRDRDEYKVILQFIKDERERYFSDLSMCEGERDVMKVVGSIATLDALHQILS